MLRNIIYRDNDVEIVLIADASNRNVSLGVQIYHGHTTAYRTLVAWLSSDFSRASSSLLCKMKEACWVLIRDNGSVSDEIIRSVNKAVAKEVEGNFPKIREIDWTKQIPTELGSGDTA